MNVTKYLHSCLLIEEDHKTVLIDPGIYTYQEQVLAIDHLKQLDAIFITHEHADHMYVPFLKELVEAFPKVAIITNPAIVTLLQKENVKASTTMPDFAIFEDAPHENLLDMTPPINYAFTLFTKLTHPGDSLHFTKSAEILALPIQAPWGSMVQAAAKAVAIKPQVILPIHDWHWKDGVRKQFYERLTAYFNQLGITFTGIETGEQVTI